MPKNPGSSLRGYFNKKKRLRDLAIVLGLFFIILASITFECAIFYLISFDTRIVVSNQILLMTLKIAKGLDEMEIVPLLIVLVNILAKDCLSGIIIVKLGLPAVLGHMLGGVIFGPVGLGIIHHSEVISLAADFGVILMMFLVGIETNVDEMKKAGIAAVMGGIGGVIVSFVLGFFTARYIFSFSIFVSLFIGVLLTATSVSISAQTLGNLGYIRTKEGKTILGAAIVDDIFSIILLSVILGLYSSGQGNGEINVLFLLGKMMIFFLGAIVIGEKVLPWIIKILHLNKDQYTLTMTALIVCFYYSLFAEAFIGKAATITGAYIAGVCFAKRKFAHEIDQNISMLANSFFVPIFFVNVGLQVKKVPIDGELIFYALLVILIAIISKVVGSGVGAYFGRFSILESLRVGIGMVSRGEVALLICSMGLKIGIINQEVYILMIGMTIVTTIIAPILLKMSFNNVALITKINQIEGLYFKRENKQSKAYLEETL